MSDNSSKNQSKMQSANQVVKMVYLIIQVGFTMLFTIFFCIGLGYLVQRFLHLKLMILFIILGVISGFKAAYILIRKFVSFENPDDEYRRMLDTCEKSHSDDENESDEESDG